jgi:hypothetical protein
MKIPLPHPCGTPGDPRCIHAAAFTLTEMMISSALLTMIVLGIITSNLFGMRLYQITNLKLGANDEARQAISIMVDEIRSSKILLVGDGSLNSFTQDVNGTVQQGSALQVYLSTNTNNWIRYYWDKQDGKLKRTTDGSSSYAVVANSISNKLVFTVEDHFGKIVTNNQNNRVIGMLLQFYQLAYPVVSIPGPMFEYYQLRTKITRRVLE